VPLGGCSAAAISIEMERESEIIRLWVEWLAPATREAGAFGRNTAYPPKHGPTPDKRIIFAMVDDEFLEFLRLRGFLFSVEGR
jgi:hypothetical protein